MPAGKRKKGLRGTRFTHSKLLDPLCSGRGQTITRHQIRPVEIAGRRGTRPRSSTAPNLSRCPRRLATITGPRSVTWTYGVDLSGWQVAIGVNVDRADRVRHRASITASSPRREPFAGSSPSRARPKVAWWAACSPGERHMSQRESASAGNGIAAVLTLVTLAVAGCTPTPEGPTEKALGDVVPQEVCAPSGSPVYFGVMDIESAKNQGVVVDEVSLVNATGLQLVDAWWVPSNGHSDLGSSRHPDKERIPGWSWQQRLPASTTLPDSSPAYELVVAVDAPNKSGRSDAVAVDYRTDDGSSGDYRATAPVTLILADPATGGCMASG